MDGGVVLSPNVTRTKVQVDVNGNEVVRNRATKQIELVKPAEVPYAPTPEELAVLAARPPEAGLARMDESEVVPIEQVKAAQVVQPSEPMQTASAKPENPLAEMIRKQVQEQVKKQLATIDIGAMVSEAIKDAFK